MVVFNACLVQQASAVPLAQEPVVHVDVLEIGPDVFGVVMDDSEYRYPFGSASMPFGANTRPGVTASHGWRFRQARAHWHLYVHALPCFLRDVCTGGPARQDFVFEEAPGTCGLWRGCAPWHGRCFFCPDLVSLWGIGG